MTTSQPRYDLIIFDLDGVITTEHIYWECARLTLWELLYLRLGVASPYINAVHVVEAREAILPQSLIFTIKNRAINSNWDLTFLASCALLRALPCHACEGVATAESLLEALGRVAHAPIAWPAAVGGLLASAENRTGVDLLRFAGQQASDAIGANPDLFTLEGAWWQYLYGRFQLWFSGQLTGVWGAGPLTERPVLPLPAIKQVLDSLRDTGCLLGTATGRPLDEAEPPLRAFGLWDYFEPSRMATHTLVESAQQQTGQTGLGKPHPFAVRRAMFPDAPIEALIGDAAPQATMSAVLIGDSASDALAARAAGIPCIGVLSGVDGDVARQERQAALMAAGCQAVINDVSELPGWLGLTD